MEKNILAGLVLGLVLFSCSGRIVAPTQAPAYTPDYGNSAGSLIVDVQTNNTKEQASLIAAGVSDYGALTQGRNAWYYFTADSLKNYTITVAPINTDGHVNFFIYNKDGYSVTYQSHNEYTLYPTYSGIYYVEVMSTSDQAVSYLITVTEVVPNS
jgi:hypothetical protein